MSDRRRTLPPPSPRNRDVGGFSVQPGELEPTEPGEAEVVDLRTAQPTTTESPLTNGVAAPATDQPAEPKRKARKTASTAEKTDARDDKVPRRRLTATLTPPLRDALVARTEELRGSRTDILIDAVMNHSVALAAEYEPDEDLKRRQALGVRSVRQRRPPGRVDVQFYLSEQELQVIESGAADSGYDVRSDYIEELLARELQL